MVVCLRSRKLTNEKKTMSEDSVKQALSNLKPDINSIIFSAWKYFKDLPESTRMRFPRTRANIVWERIGINADDVLSQHENIRIVKIQGSLWYWVGENLIFRFKKGDRAGYSRNYPTQTSLAFHNPQSNLIPDVQRVDIVYVLDVAETAIDDILVVARKKDAIEWVFSILETENNVVQLPTHNVPELQKSTTVAKLKEGIIVDNKIIIKD